MKVKTNIKHIILCIVLLAISISCSTISISSTNTLLEKYSVAGSKKLQSPFSGTVLIAKNGKVFLKKAYGYQDRAKEIPNTVATKFPIGSITKQFTALLIMQMIENGTLNLQDPIIKHLPYLKSSWSKKITIHQLLSHTSGLPHYEGILSLGLNRRTFATSKYTSKTLAELVDRVTLSYTPGTKFYYSSLGYMLLGTILEEVSGKRYAQLLQERITGPLRLKNTGFATNEFIRTQTAKGYRFVKDKSTQKTVQKYGGQFKPTPLRDQSNKFSTGGMHSTVEDLWIWSKALQNHTLLSKKYTDLLLTPNKDGYCYGWIRNWDELIERNSTVRMYTHGGTLYGHTASINLYDNGTTIIYLTNTTPLKTQELTHQLYLSFYGLKDTLAVKGYPNTSSLTTFEKQGGIQALHSYFDKMSELCGYPILPSENSIARIMSLHYINGQQRVGDSIKTAYFTRYTPTENTINRLGYHLLKKNCSVAIEFFKENTLRFPNSPNVWDSYGEGLLACGQQKEAIQSFEKAVQIAKKKRHRNLKLFQKNLATAKKQ